MYICTYITWLCFSYLSVCLSVEQVPLRCVPDQWLWRWDDVSPREWRTLLWSIHPYEGGSGNSPQKVKHSGAGVKAVLKDKSRNTGKATHRYCVLHSVRQFPYLYSFYKCIDYNVYQQIRVEYSLYCSSVEYVNNLVNLVNIFEGYIYFNV